MASTTRLQTSYGESPCNPRWATKRTPERFTIGPQIAAVAEKIGLPLMPWQRLVADVGGELDPNTGLPAYREIVVTVPRQSGKTTLILSWEVQRAIGWDEPQRIAYSAQSGNDARKKLIEDQVPILERYRKTLGIARILRGMGNEAVEFRNGSRITLLASTQESGHGKTLDLGVKDELFADEDDRRDQAMVPAMATKSRAQMLTASTMGTDDSRALNRVVDRGRVAVEADARHGIAYFEWSAHPDDDPDDPATWWSCMPALGYTVTEDVVRHARMTMADGEFRRAFLNVSTKADRRVIPQALWEACADPRSQADAVSSFAVDVTPDRSRASVAVFGLRADGLPHVEVVDHRRGTDWVAERAAELVRKWGGRLILDASGPAASLIPELENAGVELVLTSGRDMAQACGAFYDSVGRGVLRHIDQPELNAAVAGASKRSLGDAWAWSRKSSTVDISPLVAVTLAAWGAGQSNDEGEVNLW